ncbi:hypothetical protein BJ508DRAFT_19924 [Ascobolus immersus RN42]|uniref:Uncharacterized protein n=1 Tax=Ascobolus immersus RN42 TaxID=1160509 RepID=A0A3N4IGF7_ASCIM|nr:hypothetical protein BJ508DRAFT_19924 [Ascobolus immersus RN42]
MEVQECSKAQIHTMASGHCQKSNKRHGSNTITHTTTIARFQPIALTKNPKLLSSCLKKCQALPPNTSRGLRGEALCSRKGMAGRSFHICGNVGTDEEDKAH